MLLHWVHVRVHHDCFMHVTRCSVDVVVHIFYLIGTVAVCILDVVGAVAVLICVCCLDVVLYRRRQTCSSNPQGVQGIIAICCFRGPAVGGKGGMFIIIFVRFTPGVVAMAGRGRSRCSLDVVVPCVAVVGVAQAIGRDVQGFTAVCCLCVLAVVG